VDVWRIVQLLGASIPIIAVGGAVGLSVVADPDWDWLLLRLRLEELPEEERMRAQKAYRVCHDVTYFIVGTAIELYSEAKIADVRGVLVVDGVKSTAERFEEAFKREISWLARDLGVDPYILEDAFYPAVRDLVYMAKSMLQKVERHEPPSEIYESAKLRLSMVLSSAMDSYVVCLSKLGVLKAPVR
jgi:hypothetical protein